MEKMENNLGQVILVRDINLGSDYSFNDSNIYNLEVFKNKVYFSANDGVSGRELWVSDGTTGGTQLIKNINLGRNSYGTPRSSNPNDFVEVNNKLYFTANDRVNGRELWVTNGTENGTKLVADINPGSDSSVSSYSDSLTEFNNKLLFAANDGVNGRELWVSDGTSAGTKLVKDINPGNFEGYYGEIYPNSSNPSYFTELNNKLLFTANDGVNGRELWVTDGTSAETKLVKDINSGSDSSLNSYSGAEFTELNDKLLFTADDGVNGRELWVSDGTSAGTKLVKDINPGSFEGYYGETYPYSSSPSDFTELNDKLLFSANDGVDGRELWVSDGTSAGTKLVKDINPGSDSSLNSYSGAKFTELNDKLLFTADDGVNGRELWVTDGTSAGTKLVKDINPSSFEGYYGETYPDSSSPRDFTVFNNKLYFVADDGVNGRELWITDGTESGTQLVADINPGSESSDVSSLTVVDRELLFVANNGNTGRELFKLSFDNSTTITGTNRADSLSGNNLNNKIEGLNGEDTLSGLGGNDTLTGGNGKDSLDGGAGNDSLLGGSASDTLLGGNGNDILDGGSGSNILTGGLGNDVFAIRSGSGSESIADFKLGKDLIGLTGELEFDDLILSGNTIKSGSDLLATLTGVETVGLTETDFTAI
jgi:ELWxxDGT repeat protein